MIHPQVIGTKPVIIGPPLLVADKGRTDLAGSPKEEALARFESAKRLTALSEFVEAMPGAISGSVCGRSISRKPTSTIGYERQFNRALAKKDPDEFLSFMLSDVPERPARADKTRMGNLGLA